MYVGPVEAGVELLTTRTVRDMDVEYRAPQDVLERVLVVNNSTPAPLLQNEETRWEKVTPGTCGETIPSGFARNLWPLRSDRFERFTNKAPGFAGGYLLNPDQVVQQFYDSEDLLPASTAVSPAVSSLS